MKKTSKTPTSRSKKLLVRRERIRNLGLSSLKVIVGGDISTGSKETVIHTSTVETNVQSNPSTCD